MFHLYVCIIIIGDLTGATTAQLMTEQQSTDEQKQSAGTSVGLAVGLTFFFLVLILSAVGAVVVVIVILVVMKKRLINKEGKLYLVYIYCIYRQM